MARTIRTYYVEGTSGKEARAMVELDDKDLRTLDVLEPGWSPSGAFKKDPGEALTKLCDHNLKAAVRVVLEAGLVEICRTALDRVQEWSKAARTVRKAPLGIWTAEPEKEEEAD